MTNEFGSEEKEYERWPKQFGDFAEELVMYMLGGMMGMSVALIDHVGADIIAAEKDGQKRKYAISVKGRNFPDNETRSKGFGKGDQDKLRKVSTTFDMKAAVAFVFVDTL